MQFFFPCLFQVLNVKLHLFNQRYVIITDMFWRSNWSIILLILLLYAIQEKKLVAEIKQTAKTGNEASLFFHEHKVVMDMSCNLVAIKIQGMIFHYCLVSYCSIFCYHIIYSSFSVGSHYCSCQSLYVFNFYCSVTRLICKNARNLRSLI